jgi:hypothetical protein
MIEVDGFSSRLKGKYARGCTGSGSDFTINCLGQYYQRNFSAKLWMPFI